LHEQLGLRAPDEAPVFTAANLVLRLRAVAPRVERFGSIASLL
jgi:hypothetical protein